VASGLTLASERSMVHLPSKGMVYNKVPSFHVERSFLYNFIAAWGDQEESLVECIILDSDQRHPTPRILNVTD
jgi:hypothetical protein